MTISRCRKLLLSAAGCLVAWAAAHGEFPIEWTEKFNPRNQCTPACAPQWGYHPTAWRPWNGEEADYQPHPTAIRPGGLRPDQFPPGVDPAEIYNPNAIPRTSPYTVPSRYGAPTMRPELPPAPTNLPQGPADAPPMLRYPEKTSQFRGMPVDRRLPPRSTPSIAGNAAEIHRAAPQMTSERGPFDAGYSDDEPTRFQRERTAREVAARPAMQVEPGFDRHDDEGMPSSQPPRRRATQPMHESMPTAPSSTGPAPSMARGAFGYTDEAPATTKSPPTGEIVHWNGTRRKAPPGEQAAAPARRATQVTSDQWPPAPSTTPARANDPLDAWPSAGLRR